MDTAVFGTRFWLWSLIQHEVNILQLNRVSSLIPYLPIFHFLTSPTVPHFYSSLLQCKLTVLYLLASMLYYFQAKTLFDHNETYAHISLSPTRTILAPSDDAFFNFYLNQIFFARTSLVHNCCS